MNDNNTGINVNDANNAQNITITAPIPTDLSIIISNVSKLTKPTRLVHAEKNIAGPALVCVLIIAWVTSFE